MRRRALLSTLLIGGFVLLSGMLALRPAIDPPLGDEGEGEGQSEGEDDGGTESPSPPAAPEPSEPPQPDDLEDDRPPTEPA